MNYYPFHIGDYISHTNHLSDAEDLAYRRMIDLYFLTEQPFNDSSTVARKVKAELSIVENLLHEFFTLEEDDCWHNKRVDEEIARYHSRLDQASRAGKASAEARLNTRSTPVQLTRTRTINHNHINTTQPEGFDLFWNSYDKKVGKPNAIKQWQKIKPDAELIITIVHKAKADKVAKPDNKYRKDPERWLKGQHWLDEVIVEQAVKAKELPLGTNEQIEQAYRLECGKDPALARFNSYFDMKNYIIKYREQKAVHG